MSNQLSILTEINNMWQVTEPFKSIVKHRIFSPLFFFSFPYPGGVGGGGAAAPLNSKVLQVSSTPLASSNGILPPCQRKSTQPPV